MKIQIPTNCPVCGSALERVNSQLFCRNSSNCSAQSSKSLEAFCKKMKLKGFGEKTLEKLEISSVPELFNLTSKELVNAAGDKVGAKLDAELQRMRNGVSLSTLLAALSIPLVGTVAAEKASVGASGLADVSLGDTKAGANLRTWQESSSGKEIISLPWVFEANVTQKNESSEPLGIAVCITGKLEQYKSRSDAKAYLESLGFTVKSSVTKDVKYLICEDDSKRSSSSYLKAQSNGIPIGSIAKLLLTKEKL